MRLNAFRAYLTSRFASEFDTFDAYQFVGTVSEFSTALTTWNRPEGADVEHIDALELLSDARNPVDARARFEGRLKALTARVHGRSLVVLAGLHMIAWLYDTEMLTVVVAALRRGSRVVVFVTPALAGASLPARVFLTDWRATVRDFVGAEHVVIGTGGE